MAIRRLSFALSIAAAIASSACSKTEPPAVESAPVAAEPAATAAPSAPPAPSAAPAASVVVEADAGVDAKAHATATASTKSGTNAADAEAGPTCGKKPLPDCPMQAWMKANTSAAMSSKDFAALEVALKKTATLAPGAGYPNWISISKDGAEAARTQDIGALKASCRGCHDQYKSKYKAELRTRPVT